MTLTEHHSTPLSLAIRRHHQLKTVTTMSETIERLRKSKADYVKSEIEAGRQDGISWVQNRADYAELKQLEHFEFDAGDLKFSRQLADQFLVSDVGGDEDWYLRSDFYVEAFAIAAKEVWDSVKHLLN